MSIAAQARMYNTTHYQADTKTSKDNVEAQISAAGKVETALIQLSALTGGQTPMPNAQVLMAQIQAIQTSNEVRQRLIQSHYEPKLEAMQNELEQITKVVAENTESSFSVFG